MVQIGNTYLTTMATWGVKLSKTKRKHRNHSFLMNKLHTNHPICHTQLPAVSLYSFYVIFHIKINKLLTSWLFWITFVPSPGNQIWVSVFFVCECALIPLTHKLHQYNYIATKRPKRCEDSSRYYGRPYI